MFQNNYITLVSFRFKIFTVDLTKIHFKRIIVVYIFLFSIAKIEKGQTIILCLHIILFSILDILTLDGKYSLKQQGFNFYKLDCS